MIKSQIKKSGEVCQSSFHIDDLQFVRLDSNKFKPTNKQSGKERQTQDFPVIQTLISVDFHTNRVEQIGVDLMLVSRRFLRIETHPKHKRKLPSPHTNPCW